MVSGSEEHIQELLNRFEALQGQQWNKGAAEYGEMAFVKLSDSEMLQMFLEELADICNYARFTAVRLMLWQEAKDEGSLDSPVQPPRSDAEYPVSPGAGAFVGGTEVQGFLLGRERVQDPGQWSSRGEDDSPT